MLVGFLTKQSPNLFREKEKLQRFNTAQSRFNFCKAFF